MRADFSARAVFDSVPATGPLHSAPGLRVAPLGGFVRADFSARAVFGALHSAPGLRALHSAAFMRAGFSARRGVRLGAGNGAASLGAGSAVAPLGAFVRASFSELLVVQLSVEDTGAFTRCGSAWTAPLGAAVRAAWVCSCVMRTTIRLDDALLLEVKREAAETGMTLTAVIEESLRERLARRATSSEPRTRPGVDLDDSAALLDVMEGK